MPEPHHRSRSGVPISVKFFLYSFSQRKGRNTSDGSNSGPNSRANCSGSLPLGVDAAAGVGLKPGAFSPHHSNHSQLYLNIEAEHRANWFSHPQAGEPNRTCCLATLCQGLTFFSLHPGRRKSSLLLRPERQLVLSMIPSNPSLRQNSERLR